MRGLLMRIFWPWAKTIKSLEDRLWSARGELLKIRQMAIQQHVWTDGKSIPDVVAEIIADGNKAWDRVHSLNHEIARLTRELDGARTSCDKLDSALSEARAARDKYAEERNDLAVQLAKVEDDRKYLLALNDRGLKDLQTVRDEKIDDLERQLASLRARIANAVDQLEGPRSFPVKKKPESEASRDAYGEWRWLMDSYGTRTTA